MAEHLIEMGRGRCGKGEIWRVGYDRKDGVHVKGTCVSDTGAPGKTPASKRWLPKNLEHLGWKKGQSDAKRHSLLKKKVEQAGCRPIIRTLVARANVTTDRETERKMRADAAWLHKQGFCKLKTKVAGGY